MNLRYLFTAGIGWSDDPRPFFVRPATLSLLASLEQSSTVYSLLMIQGSAGTGKSSSAWWFAREFAKTRNAKVAWIHISKLMPVTCVLLDGDDLCVDSGFSKAIRSGTFEFSAALSTCRLVFVDGVYEDAAEWCSIALPAVAWLAEEKDRRLVLVGSVKVMLPASEPTAFEQRTHFCGPWTFDEYAAACLNDEFFASIKDCLEEVKLEPDEQVVDTLSDSATSSAATLASVFPERYQALFDKFFFAGTNARWMFAMTLSGVKSAIGMYTSRIGNISDALTANAGGAAKFAVTQLFPLVSFGENAVIVSQYVARRLSSKVEASFLQMALVNPALQQIPSLDGWIFQMDFFYQLLVASRMNTKLSVRHKDNDHIDEWDVGAIRSFYNLDDVSVFSNSIRENDWLNPTKVNQGCYDAVQLCKDRIRFVQVTRAKSHSLKLSYVIALVKCLRSLGCNFDDIDIVVVVPLCQLQRFAISQSTVYSDRALRALFPKWGLHAVQVVGLRRTGESDR